MALLVTSLAALLFLQDAQDAEPTPAPSPPAGCTTEEYAAFDFWVGEWNVTPNGQDQQVATSRIEKVAGGCAIRETWMPNNGPGGVSLTTRDPDSGTWNQLWVGSTPGRVFFEGGPVDGEMVLIGYWGADASGTPQMIRMTYSLQDDGSVRQHGELSTDHGGTWGNAFDFIYRPRAE